MKGSVNIQRHGQIIKIRPGKLEEYREIHSDAWPQVLEMIRKCNIRNYSIFHRDGYLFAYFEYTGEDFKADMARMAADPVTQKWWSITDLMQEPLESREEGEWWAEMEEVFHTD
jgi:L-rhamnose mutarotase